jgi:hypothetical protein
MRALVVSNLLCAQQSSFHGSLCKSTLRWIFLCKFWMNGYMSIHSFASCPNSKSTSYHWKWFHQYGPVTLCICMLLGMDGFVALQSSRPNPCSVCMISRFNGRTPSFWQQRSRTSSRNRRQLIGAELFCSCPKRIWTIIKLLSHHPQIFSCQFLTVQVSHVPHSNYVDILFGS